MLNFFSKHSIHTEEHINPKGRELNKSSQSEHIHEVWPTSGNRRPPASQDGPFQYWSPRAPARAPLPWLLKLLSQGLHIFTFRQCKMVFQSAYDNLHSHQQWTRTLFFHILANTQVFFAFFISAIPVGAWRYHVGFHSYSLITNEVVYFLC